MKWNIGLTFEFNEIATNLYVTSIMLQLRCTRLFYLLNTDNGIYVVDTSNLQAVISSLDHQLFKMTYWGLAVHVIQDLLFESIAEIS